MPWGSRQGQMVPSDFLGYVNEETYSVGLVTGVIIPWSTMCWRAFSISSLASIGTFLQACWTGVLRGPKYSIFSWYVSCCVKTGWEDMFNAIMSLTLAEVWWSWEGATFWTLWYWKGATGWMWSCKGASKWCWKGVTGEEWPWKGVLMTDFGWQLPLLFGFCRVSSRCVVKVTVLGLVMASRIAVKMLVFHLGL